MEAGSGSSLTWELGELAEALPQPIAALTRLFLRQSSVPVTRTELGVLYALWEHPRRVTELALREGVTQPAISLLVNRLERRGWVSRGGDADDGRVVVVSLTDPGEEVVNRLRGEYRALLHDEMAALETHGL